MGAGGHLTGSDRRSGRAVSRAGASGTNSRAVSSSSASLAPPPANLSRTAATRTGACAVAKPSASPGSPITPQDSSTFGARGDVTYPDCSTVEVGQTFVKQWRLDNVGSATWVGRSLWRMGTQRSNTACKTAQRATVPRTAPGGFAVISISVTAPRTAQTCYVKFEMFDAQGRRTFPGARPVYFYVYVVV